jgi:hypothetical protein
MHRICSLLRLLLPHGARHRGAAGRVVAATVRRHPCVALHVCCLPATVTATPPAQQIVVTARRSQTHSGQLRQRQVGQQVVPKQAEQGP